MNAPEHIETDRLRFRLPHLGDAAVIFKLYARDPAVTRFLSWRTHQTLEETVAYLHDRVRAWTDGSAFTYALTLKDSGRLLGMIELRRDHGRLTLGYVLAQMYWGKGYMTEAVQAATQWALAQPRVHRLGAICDAENVGSQRVLTRAGWTCEGTLRRWERFPNLGDVARDCLSYSKVRE